MAQTNRELNVNNSENQPLLRDQDDELIEPPAENAPTTSHSVVSAPPPYPDEPPPYTPSSFCNTDPTIVCRVCQNLIPVLGRENQRVIKCSNCQEATPIKPPPEGKKYIRCPCNALLTCKVTSTRISCPRTDCKRIITVGSTVPSTSHVVNSPNFHREIIVRVSCGHCNETFIFRNTAHLARCPHCHRVSSVGSTFARNRALIFAMIGFLFLAVGIGVTVATLEMATKKGGIYVIWVGAFIAGILNLIRSCYYCTMTVSHIEGTA
ncbi:type 2 phosphatidylinositol 4,5-bisphosphate 4-phosphatase-like [Xenia sp. Carnegie-2017]|uniref:type 2 phosphatidylinositol 4,5-bisphosphate 4-phosphatase-like n=1 Tax=Xenia sp. Carnegie-2017 TaxID=2897299 RepID=UPI001F0399E1|nr:type 2 phosphatidylinositol 4,5-bisphosphate 4-phosphatase-like [Xenia sp. Carnegie-2017]